MTAVSSFLAAHNGWITEASNHADAETRELFMRQEMSRWQSDELNIDIPCVISNHETFRGLVEWHGIRFEHVPVTPDNKLAAYAKVEQIYQEAQGDVMVLARYMQILSPGLCDRHPGQIINIHHSFLPSFVGAKP